MRDIVKNRTRCRKITTHFSHPRSSSEPTPPTQPNRGTLCIEPLEGRDAIAGITDRIISSRGLEGEEKGAVLPCLDRSCLVPLDVPRVFALRWIFYLAVCASIACCTRRRTWRSEDSNSV